MKNKEVTLAILLTLVVAAGLMVYFAFINPNLLHSVMDITPAVDETAQWVDGGLKATYDSTSDLVIPLENTEGKTFKVSGQVWLNGPSTSPTFTIGNAPSGFTLYVRQADVTHRYEFNSNFTRDKRRLLAGHVETDIANRTEFPAPALHVWIPFILTVSGDKIIYTFGQNSDVFPGPLDTDGNNQIIINPGSRLRGLKLQIQTAPKAK